ncbi:HNH endonuclease domain-containing protein [Candidatus Poriferisocius sp.]|uniref:HNH endonuclease domain-containing protein n=1 Tax=Candidatus Poriferisocius sp. TaxID=3101276 RepID=UPI003B019264
MGHEDPVHTSDTRLDPIEGVLAILEQASMAGTNKLGLLLVVLDLAPEISENNRPISQDELAKKYLELHWEHARPYGETELRHSFVKKERNDGSFAQDTTVMQQVRYMREEIIQRKYGSLADNILDVVRSKLDNITWWEECWDGALKDVKKSLWRNPVDKLQNLPGNPEPFLFEIKGCTIQFIPGVIEKLSRFAGVLRPLVEWRFAELVTDLNKKDLGSTTECQIYEHLFGVKRNMPPIAMRNELVDLQGNKCIYSSEILGSSGQSLDHVVPWSRARLTQVENLVLTSKRVNSSKSNLLLGPEPFERWISYLEKNAASMSEIAARYDWPSDLENVQVTSYDIYNMLDPTTGVWNGKREGVHPIGVLSIQNIKQMLS